MLGHCAWLTPNSAHPELVEGLFFLLKTADGARIQIRPFDKLRADGVSFGGLRYEPQLGLLEMIVR